MPTGLVASSVLLVVMAKLVLAENARVAARQCGIAMGYGTALRLYNVSQLGKYIPGSIWQFVGRAAAYRERGAAFAAIRDSLLIESLWVVASALVIGATLVGIRALELLRAAASESIFLWLAALVVVGLLLTAMAFIWKRALLMRYLRLAWPGPWLLTVQLITWVLLGLSFWVLTEAAGMKVDVAYAIGIFALAFALGFMVPIAPAGLGIRDGILTLGLLAHGSLQIAVVITVVARLVYLVAELGLVGIQELMIVMRPGRRDRAL